MAGSVQWKFETCKEEVNKLSDKKQAKNILNLLFLFTVSFAYCAKLLIIIMIDSSSEEMEEDPLS